MAGHIARVLYQCHGLREQAEVELGLLEAEVLGDARLRGLGEVKFTGFGPRKQVIVGITDYE